MERLADSRYAWARLVVTLALMTIGSSGMYVVAVVLPSVQAEFGVARADASLPYTLMMVGFGIGGVLMGKLADRWGVMWPLLLGAAGVSLGFAGAALAPNIWVFALVHGVLLGMLGCSATFAPLVADTSLWFVQRRGIAVAICASGNYLAGAFWPPVMQYFFETSGWRATYIGIGIFCTIAMLALAFALRRKPPALETTATAAMIERSEKPLGMAPNALMALLVIAGVGCCVAMAMPRTARSPEPTSAFSALRPETSASPEPTFTS